ncbi:MAG: alpha/beta fold hydrolase [Amphiplicatus sp.]
MRIKIMIAALAPFFAFSLVSSCVSFPGAPPALVAPTIRNGVLIARDGAALGLDRWRADAPTAVILAVHGMNDYAHHFEALGEYLRRDGISLYAYDQRGFGRSPEFGRWPGAETLTADLRAAIAATRAENPGLPLFVLGHSMGAAVVMAAAAEAPLDVDGAIFAAPGVWGGAQLPILYRVALNVAANLAPGKTLTGRRASRQSTDNIAFLREMFADPYVIKPTRLDAVLGVVRLMGEAYKVSDEIGGAALFLYGDKDEIIPVKAMRRTARRLCGDVEIHRYGEGWHLLFRDLAAKLVYRDVADWVRRQSEKHTGPARGVGPAAFACPAATQENQTGASQHAAFGAAG